MAPARDAPTPVASPPRPAPAASKRPTTPVASAYAALADDHLPKTTRDRDPERAREPTPNPEPGTIPNADDDAPTTRTTSSGGVAPIDDEPPPFVSPFKSRVKPAPPSFATLRPAPAPFAPTLRETPRLFARANDAEPTLGGGFERVPARSNSDSDSTSTSTSRCKPSGGWFSGRGGDYSARREGVSFRGSDGAGDEGEIAALQRVIEDMTEERLALQRGLDRQQELMQTLAEENESLTSRLNEQASETSEWREELERLREEARARDALTSALTEQRDVARAAAIESRERATRSSVEAIELEERMLEMRSSRFECVERWTRSARTGKDRIGRFAPPPPIGTRCGRRSRRCDRNENRSSRNFDEWRCEKSWRWPKVRRATTATTATRGGARIRERGRGRGRGTGSGRERAGVRPADRRTRRRPRRRPPRTTRPPNWTLAREKIAARRVSRLILATRSPTRGRTGEAPRARTTTRREVSSISCRAR